MMTGRLVILVLLGVFTLQTEYIYGELLNKHARSSTFIKLSEYQKQQLVNYFDVESCRIHSCLKIVNDYIEIISYI